MFEGMVISERNLLEIFFPITKGLPPRVIIGFQLIKKEPSKIECNSDFLFFVVVSVCQPLAKKFSYF